MNSLEISKNQFLFSYNKHLKEFMYLSQSSCISSFDFSVDSSYIPIVINYK